MFKTQKNRAQWLLGAIFLAMTLLLSACGGGGGGGGGSDNPDLDLSRTTLTFSANTPGGTNPATQTFTVTNSGAAGTTLDWSLTDDAAWLSVAPASGSLAAGASQTVTVSVDISGLAAGIQNATITASAGSLSASVAVQLNIAQVLPALGVSATNLTFTASTEGGANPADQIFVVTNTGSAGTTLDWSVVDNADWLAVSPASGSLATAATQDVTVSVDLTGLLSGTYNGTITVSGTGLSAKTIAVQLTIGQALAVNPASLTLNVTAGNNPADQTVTLANASDLSVPWTATSDAAWLTMNQTSGTLAANGQATLPVIKFTTSSLAAGSYSGTITISSTAAVTGVSIPVSLTVNAAVSASKNVFIGGTAGIGQLSSLVASAGVRKAAADTTPTVLTDAKVTITVLKVDGSSSTTLSRTNAQGAYSAEVVAAAGDTITVKIEKNGFTSLNKTIKVKSADNNQYTVSGNVAQAAVQVVQAADGVFKASGGTGPGFRFGLTRRASGALVPFASSNEVVAAAAAGSVPELDISIPASWAPDATAITAELAAFDPSLPAERQMFPGEFIGVGGGSVGAAKADTTDYALESVSFFQTEVTPNNGQPLSPNVATGASKAAAEATVIYKYIPADGCTAVQKYADRDADATNGVQMPIYSYNSGSGKWIYIGEGTLKTYSGGVYTTVPAADVSTATDLSNLACGVTDYYFEILANEWYTWWNLDYPLLFAQPEITTIIGRVVDQDSNPISGAFVEADGYRGTANSYAYAYADTAGNFSLNLTTDTAAGKTAAGYVFTAYDYSTWPAESKDFTNQLPATIDPSVETDIGDVMIVGTLNCMVSGTILQESGSTTVPAPSWTWVELYSSDYSYNNWVYTNTSGYFSAKVPCNKLMTLSTWQKALTVKVDGIISSNESTDNGSLVEVADIIMINNAPDVWTWISPNPGKVGQSVLAQSSAWDYEGDYPLTYAWTIKDSGGTSVKTSSLDVFNWIPTVDDIYSVQLIVTDSLGNASTQTTNLTVNPNANTPPVIYWTWAQASAVCLGAPTFYVEAYDPDGDALVYDFSEGAPLFDAITGGWVPATAITGSSVTVTVTDDGVPSKNATATISVPQSSGLTLYYAEGWPLVQSVGAPVEIYAYADDNAGNLTTSYSWTIAGPDTSAAFISYGGDNSYGYFSASLPGTYDVTLTVTGGPCSETLTSSFSVTIEALSVAVNGQFLQFRTFETSANNSVRGWIQFADNGAAMNDWDFWGSSLYDATGAWVADAAGFDASSYTWVDYNSGTSQFGVPTYQSDSGFWYNLGAGSSLTPGTYSFVTQLAGGAEITSTVDYPGETALVPVASATMTQTWNGDGSLTLAWTEPTDTFTNYRMIFFNPINGSEFFYAKIPQGVSSVTLQVSLLSTIQTNAGVGLSSFNWRLQTRLYDASNMNYARSISDPVTISAPPGSVDVIIR